MAVTMEAMSAYVQATAVHVQAILAATILVPATTQATTAITTTIITTTIITTIITTATIVRTTPPLRLTAHTTVALGRVRALPTIGDSAGYTPRSPQCSASP